MIKRTNFLRIAALSLALVAPFCNVYAEDATSINSFEAAFNLIKTVKIDEACIEELKIALLDAETLAQELYNQAKICSDAVTCEALNKQLAELNAISTELIKKVDFLHIQRGFDDLARELSWTQSGITHHSAKAQQMLMDTRNIFWNSINNFAKAIISRNTYSEAWQVVVAPDTLLGKAEILWDHHRPAVVGAAIAATTVTACILGRDKIKAGLYKVKAGLYRLKQSAKFVWDVCKQV